MDNRHCIEMLDTLGFLKEAKKNKDMDFEVLYRSNYEVYRLVKIIDASIVEEVSLILGLIYDSEHVKVMEEIEKQCKNIVRYLDKQRAINVISYFYVLFKLKYDTSGHKLRFNDVVAGIKSAKVLEEKVDRKILVNINNQKIPVHVKGDNIRNIRWLEINENDLIRALVLKDNKCEIVKYEQGYVEKLSQYIKEDNFDLMIVAYNGVNERLSWRKE